MNTLIPEPIARQPWQMLIPLAVLVAFGAAVLFSAAGGSMDPFATSHLVRFGLFLTMAAIMTLFSRNFVRLFAYPVYAFVLILLMAVEAIGAMGGGSQRWIDFGFFVLQPSELMKPAIVLTLARFYDSLPAGMTNTWRSILPAGILIALPMALVLLQPDLGTALAIGFGGAVVNVRQAKRQCHNECTQ